MNKSILALLFIALAVGPTLAVHKLRNSGNTGGNHGSLSESDIKQIADYIFYSLDANGDSKITKSEFVSGVQAFCKSYGEAAPSKSELEKDFGEADTNHDGNLCYNEVENAVRYLASHDDSTSSSFIRMSKKASLVQKKAKKNNHGGLTESDIKQIADYIFYGLDANGNSKISKSEFVSGVQAFCKSYGEAAPSKSELEKDFGEADTNHDGNLSYNEVENAIRYLASHDDSTSSSFLRMSKKANKVLAQNREQ